MKKWLIGPAIGLALVAGHRGLAAEPVERNPFARPTVRSVSSSAGQVSTQSAPAFELRATMAAGADSLVNVDGRIVAVGGIHAGFRLISVGEGTAVFIKDGVRYPMTVAGRRGDQE